MFFVLGLIEPERFKSTLVCIGKKLGDFMDEIDKLYSFKEVTRRLTREGLDATLQEILSENSKIEQELEVLKKQEI